MKLIKNIAAYRLGRPKNLKIVSVWHIRKFTYRDILGLKAQLHAFSIVKWGRKIIYASTSNMFGSCMPELMAGQHKVSHTNDVSFSLPSKKILKWLVWCSANIVYVCDNEVWVHFISHYFCMMKLGNIKCDLCHTITKLEFWSEIQ